MPVANFIKALRKRFEIIDLDLLDIKLSQQLFKRTFFYYCILKQLAYLEWENSYMEGYVVLKI